MNEKLVDLSWIKSTNFFIYNNQLINLRLCDKIRRIRIIGGSK